MEVYCQHVRVAGNPKGFYRNVSCEIPLALHLWQYRQTNQSIPWGAVDKSYTTLYVYLPFLFLQVGNGVFIDYFISSFKIGFYFSVLIFVCCKLVPYFQASIGSVLLS